MHYKNKNKNSDYAVELNKVVKQESHSPLILNESKSKFSYAL